MWFILSLTAMLMLVSRRSAEKQVTGKIPATAMAWLQQLVGIPFMLALLPFAAFYNPWQLGHGFLIPTILYVVFSSLDVIIYFKALELGDISVIAPLLSLATVSGLIGAYIILGQQPTMYGLIGSALIITGAYLVGKRTKHHHSTAINNRLAILLALVLVSFRGLYSPLEVIALRHSNPIYFNFITSALSVPLIMLIMYLRGHAKGQPVFSRELHQKVKYHWIGLLLIGLTYTINLTCTYAAKVIAPDAAYVVTVKGAQVLPMVILGALFFKEHVTKRQWVGTVIIFVGLLCFLGA